MRSHLSIIIETGGTGDAKIPPKSFVLGENPNPGAKYYDFTSPGTNSTCTQTIAGVTHSFTKYTVKCDSGCDAHEEESN